MSTPHNDGLRFPPETFSLPEGWSWEITRVIHCLPDDQCDGWRCSLVCAGIARIEVLHRNQHHARAIALEAAGELYPEVFPQWASVKRGPK